MDKEAALLKLEETRVQLLALVNNSIDSLADRLNSGEPLTEDGSFATETTYPLSANPALFKGTKPTAIFFGEEKIEVKTWRKAYTIILQRCAAIPKHRDRLMYLRNKITGRSRTFLSDTPDGMDAPIEIAEGIYAESYLDTEWLIRLLTTEILHHAHYDYSDISVSVTTSKTGSSTKEKRNEYSRAYREANREKINAYQRNYHAKRKKNKAVGDNLLHSRPGKAH